MNDLFSLCGVKALVTGGGRGIGYSIAEGLLEFGAELVLLGVGESAFVARDGFCSQGYKAHAVRCDIRDRQRRGEAFEEAVTLLDGKIDVLVNNAALQHRRPIEDFEMNLWDEILEADLTAVFDFSRRAAAYMKKEGYGKIINISSDSGIVSTGKDIPAYQAAKSAVAHFSKTFTDEWAAFGIRVNSIAPGFTKTDMTYDLQKNTARYENTRQHIPLQYWAQPSDYKGIAVFLASHASDYLTGVTIPVDGGFVAR